MEDFIATTIWRQRNAGANDQQMAAAILKALKADGKQIVDIDDVLALAAQGWTLFGAGSADRRASEK